MNPDPSLLLALDPSDPASSPFGMVLPLVAMVAIFYFLLWRPQQKEAQEHQKLVASLQKGDQVVTAAGIHGRIHEARPDAVVLELSPGCLMTVDRDAVRRKVTPAAAAEPAKPGKGA